MRRLAWPVLLLTLVAACDEPAPTPAPNVEPPRDPLAGLAPWSDTWVLAHAPAYLGDDPDARRGALEASLTNRANLYARTRLGAYGRGRSGWDALPEWNPRTGAMTAARAAAFGRGEAPSLDGLAPIWDGEAPTTWEGWRALGERVFFELPLRSEPYWEVALRDAARGEALGVERAPDGSVPGLVVLRDIDGEAAVGITCALCHAARGRDGAIVAGKARRRLDYGALRLAWLDAHGGTIGDDTRARWESWGPGRADVLEEIVETPIAIVDLYGLRHERLLTQAGTIRHDSPLALAVRQETQYIQANHHHTRPPRALMFALVVYLYALEPPPAAPSQASPEAIARGAELFGEQCARCHSNEAGAGDELVEVGMIGTDAELATGNARGTGGYRPSPLIRVAEAAPYFHHGVVPSLEALLTPERLEDAPGHRYGHSLSNDDRAALIAHLETL